MAKYTEWLTDEGLIKIEGWARDGLIDKRSPEYRSIRTNIYRLEKKFSSISSAQKGKKLSIAKLRMHCLRVLQATNTPKLQKN